MTTAVRSVLATADVAELALAFLDEGRRSVPALDDLPDLAAALLERRRRLRPTPIRPRQKPTRNAAHPPVRPQIAARTGQFSPSGHRTSGVACTISGESPEVIARADGKR